MAVEREGVELLLKDKVLGETLGRHSLKGYLLGASVTIWALFPELVASPVILLHVLAVFLLGLAVNKNQYGVWWRASLLGCTLSLGILFFSSDWSSRGHFISFGLFVVFLSLFHYLEYLVTAWTNPSNLSLDSFLLNHSTAYGVALGAGVSEFFVEAWLFPTLKRRLAVVFVGAVLCVMGDCLRKLAMFHAGRNFNHIVQCHKEDKHELVTSGVFSLFRHPSYVGWFLWSVATQLVLCNPLCCLVYSFVAWKFFHERIFVEEYNLVTFFGRDYLNYQRRVPVGIPFIKGFELGIANRRQE